MCAVVTPLTYLLRRNARVASAQPLLTDVLPKQGRRDLARQQADHHISVGTSRTPTANRGVWVVKMQCVCTFSLIHSPTFEEFKGEEALSGSSLIWYLPTLMPRAASIRARRSRAQIGLLSAGYSWVAARRGGRFIPRSLGCVLREVGIEEEHRHEAADRTPVIVEPRPGSRRFASPRIRNGPPAGRVPACAL